MQYNAERTRTKPHRIVEALLSSLKISYLSECADFPPYLLDLYLGEWHICIEIDGPQHRPTRDAIRDAALRTNYGIETLRIPSDTIARNDEAEQKVAFRILRYIEHHADTTEDRKATWTRQ